MSMNALLQVYNHFASNSTRQTARYDTHKRSELRNIYHTIVKMNRESPVYMFDSSETLIEYAVSIKEHALSLNSILSSVGKSDDSTTPTMKKTAVSSDSEAVDVVYIGNLEESDDFEGFDITVSQLACPQINTGNFLPNKRLSLLPGEYSFDIQTGSICYSFQFQVSHKDTNESLQKKLSHLINKSNIGINASIIKDPNQPYTALQLISDKTGCSIEKGDTLFTVSTMPDVSHADVVQYFGLQNISQYPQNSVFSINGETHFATSNNLIVEDSFELTLNQPTLEDHPVRIGFKTNFDAFADSFRNVADAYNSILYTANHYSTQHDKSMTLYKEVSSIALEHKNTLDSIGLTVKENARIEVDENLLIQALSEDIQDTFDTVSNFKNALSEKADTIILNPMKYVNKTLVSYPNPGKTFANPYITSIYSGMLFNNYC